MKKRKILISISCGVIAALISIVCILIYRQKQRLDQNASFLNYSLSNMNRSEVKDLVAEKINTIFQKEKIKLKVQNKVFQLNPSAIDVHFNPQDIFKYAKNKSENKNDEPLPLIKYNKKKLEKFITELSQKTKTKPQKFRYKKLEDSVITRAGTPGQEIVVEKTIPKILESLQNLKFNLISPVIRKITGDISKINLNEIKKSVDVAVKDATFKIQNGKRIYQDEVVGVNLDLDKSKKIVTNSLVGKYKLPINIIRPNETVKGLKSKHQNPSTPHVLSSFSTNFSSSGNQNRNHNIRLAASAINGVILLPGEEFSFGATAGRASGYLPAPVYSNGKESTGIGGGMCQVSTTLFNTALKANMTISQRTCHSRTVDYVPKGRDATYDGSGTDFRFINSLKNPIRIQSFASNSSVTVNILGTKIPEENFDVSLNSQITSRTSSRLNAVFNVTVSLNGQVVKNKTFHSSYKL